jgi:hypothetical protein
MTRRAVRAIQHTLNVPDNMADNETLVQIEQIESVERLLVGLQRTAADSLRRTRERVKLSLRDVAVQVDLTPAGLHNIERAKTWRTKTARRVAEFYSKMDAA